MTQTTVSIVFRLSISSHTITVNMEIHSKNNQNSFIILREIKANVGIVIPDT